MFGVAFLRLRLQSCSKITESYSNPAPVYVKNQNSKSCFHSCYSKNFCKLCNHNVIQTLGLKSPRMRGELCSRTREQVVLICQQIQKQTLCDWKGEISSGLSKWVFEFHQLQVQNCKTKSVRIEQSHPG